MATTPKEGNTPTHVGKTRCEERVIPPPQKHPHARGEDVWKEHPSNPRQETPPRTWGRPAMGTLLADPVGNTPTHVGKTGWDEAREAIVEKHPHARGEDAPRSTPLWRA